MSVERRSTARLVLRRITDDDVEAIVAVDTDPATNVHGPGGAPTVEESRRLVRAFIEAWASDGIGYWAAELNGVVIGVVGVEAWSDGRFGGPWWNLYYRLAPSAWGAGLATEAAREAVAVAVQLQPGWPVVARTRPTNAAAIRVAKRAGLERRTGLDADGYVVLAVSPR